MSEADGIDDAVDGAMRTGLMVAGRIGEQLARMREEEQRTIAAAEEHRVDGPSSRTGSTRPQHAPHTQRPPAAPAGTVDGRCGGPGTLRGSSGAVEPLGHPAGCSLSGPGFHETVISTPASCSRMFR